MVIQASGQRAFWIAVAIIAIGTSGCASLRSATSGQVGCAEDEIAITKYNASLGSRTWTAECRGKRFYCSVVETGAQQSQVSCREEVSSTVSAEFPLPRVRIRRRPARQAVNTIPSAKAIESV